MIHQLANASATRSWRDIPQPVKPRAMSRGGRRRLRSGPIRTVIGLLFVAAFSWAGWILVGALRQDPQRTPSAARSTPLRAPELKTNGVLSAAWLARQLALPKGASLMELDLRQLRTRLLADGQVESATLTRRFPAQLQVAISERSPVAKVMADWKGLQQPLLVASDGVVFLGEGYEPAMIARLPWLDGIRMSRREGNFLPIEGMRLVGDLLARGREAGVLDSSDPRRSWQVVSLARLATDHELDVRTAAGTTVVFAANGDFFGQLAKLDLLWDTLAHAPTVPGRIDLTLGREVPVMVAAPAARPTAVVVAPFLHANSRREF